MFGRAALAFAALATLGAAPAPPRRVLSLNLCADQLLVALADPGQIAGLTRLSRDPALSPIVAEARRFRSVRGTAEEVMAIDPDLVIASPWRATRTLRGADGRPVATLDLPPAESWAAVRGQIVTVGDAIGRGARARALVARLDADLARVPRATGAPVVAFYQRRGYLTGAGTLVDDLMHRLGMVNLATRLGRPALSRMPLEALVAARPDYLIVEAPGGGGIDRGAEMLAHPAIAAIPRLTLPGAATSCGGPGFVAAAKSLAAQLQAVRAAHAAPRTRRAPARHS